MSQKTEKIGDLSKYLARDSRYVFISGLGFDQRCLTILKSVKDKLKISKYYGILNIGNEKLKNSIKQEFEKEVGDKGTIIGENSKYVWELIDNLTDKLESAEDTQEYIVDTTSFNHELLLSLIALLHHKNAMSRVTFLYLGAGRYGKWLSSGVNEIRSVFGYPGKMLPSQKSHLVVMLGFEVERVKDLIYQYEPYMLSVGKSSEEESITEKHFQEHQKADEKLRGFINSMEESFQGFEHFDFSAKDPMKTKESLRQHIKQHSEYNTVLCPLNTKISTIGVALYALENKDVQLCYPEPIIYNTSSYVEIGDTVEIFKLES